MVLGQICPARSPFLMRFQRPHLPSQLVIPSHWTGLLSHFDLSCQLVFSSDGRVLEVSCLPPRPFDPLHMLRELRMLVVELMESNLSLSLDGFHPGFWPCVFSFLMGRDSINAVTIILMCTLEFVTLCVESISEARTRVRRAVGRFRIATGACADRVSGLPSVFHYGFICGLLGIFHVMLHVADRIFSRLHATVAVFGFFFPIFAVLGLPFLWSTRFAYHLYYGNGVCGILWLITDMQFTMTTFERLYEGVSPWFYFIDHLLGSFFYCVFCRLFSYTSDLFGLFSRHRGWHNAPRSRCTMAVCARPVYSRSFCWFCGPNYCMCSCPMCDPEGIWNLHRAATRIQSMWRARTPGAQAPTCVPCDPDSHEDPTRPALFGGILAQLAQVAFSGFRLAILGISESLSELLFRVLFFITLPGRILSCGVSICLLILANLSGVFAVTCRHCYDQIEGCTGGDNCPLLTGVTANAAVLGAAVGSTLVFKVTQMLPRPYLRICTRAVLDTIKSVFKRPLVAGQEDLSSMSIEALARAVKEGTSPRSDVLMAVMQLAAQVDADDSPETRSQQRKIDHLISIIRELNACQSKGESPSRTPETVGVLALIWALAGKISDHSSEAKASVSLTDSKDGDSVVTKLSEKQRRSKSMEECSERISAFTAICHALGIANVLLTTQFFREVFYDTILRDKQPWQLAHELVLVYLEDIDQSTTLTLGNVFASGAQDTRLKRAAAECLQHYKLDIFRPGPGGPAQGSTSETVKHNGKFTKTSKQVCHSFNFGKPCTHLLTDGTCKFNHICNHWVSDRGPKGRCGGNHPQAKCDNPNKCDSPVA